MTMLPDPPICLLLSRVFPSFTFTQLCWPGRRRPRWEAVRKHPGPGLYSMITPDLHELHAALVLDEIRAGRNQRPAARLPVFAPHDQRAR